MFGARGWESAVCSFSIVAQFDFRDSYDSVSVLATPKICVIHIKLSFWIYLIIWCLGLLASSYCKVSSVWWASDGKELVYREVNSFDYQ